MAHISDSYASKLAIAFELAKLRARAVTITAIAKTRTQHSSEKYQQVWGRQSPPGRTPSDHEWFLGTQQRRRHAALLLLMYHQYRVSYEPDPDAHGLAFVMAYRRYVLVTHNRPVIEINRLNLLIHTGFGIGWRGILKGGASKFDSENVKVLNCRKCRIPHLVEAHFRSYECPDHD